MREIKFRGYSKTKKCWVYGLPAYHEENIYAIQTKYRTTIQVDVISIGQYVGLQDKNGVDIYEGDIFKSGNQIHKVEYKKEYLGFGSSTIIRNITTSFPLINNIQHIEVIGNVYENIDLL